MMSKILFASDVHGSPAALKLLEKQLELLAPEQIIFLGDFLYHGPRNAMREDYAPQEAAAILNGWKGKISAVRGNCDSEVDQLLLDFPIQAEYALLLMDGHTCFLTHGHHWNAENPPPLGTADILCHGHTHIPCAEQVSETLCCWNPGSLSLPKGGFPPSFGWYENGTFTVRNLYTGEAFLSHTLPQPQEAAR